MYWDEFIDLNTGAITQGAEMADQLYRPHGQIHNWTSDSQNIRPISLKKNKIKIKKKRC